MNTKEQLICEIEQVPDTYLDELFDFVQFLKSKKLGEGLHNAIASESSLKKDWLQREENQAWQNL